MVAQTRRISAGSGLHVGTATRGAAPTELLGLTHPRKHLQLGADRYASPSGNQIPISRSADSDESLPCTRLFGIASANSPRSEPGSASAGFVAPIVLRAVAIAPSPSSTKASVGADVMKSTSSPKKGFSRCSA